MQTNRSLAVLLILFVIIAAVSSVLAVKYRAEKADLHSRLLHMRQSARVGEGKAAAQDTNPTSAVPEQVPAGKTSMIYELSNLLAQRDATVTELRKQLRELQSGAAVAAAAAKSAPAATGRPPVWVPRATPSERDEEMRRRIGALSEEMVGSIVEQEEFINGTDVSRADADQQAKHSELQKCLKHIRDLMNKARVTQDAQEARALQDEMTKNAADLESLFRYERNIIFYNAGVQLGYDNDTSRWFTDYMTYVSDMTSLPSTIRRIRQASRETAPPKSEGE